VIIRPRQAEPTPGHIDTDIADEGMMAAWQGPSKTCPNGLIQLDETHPVIHG
jgi:hypothetical protein